MKSNVTSSVGFSIHRVNGGGCWRNKGLFSTSSLDGNDVTTVRDKLCGLCVTTETTAVIVVKMMAGVVQTNEASSD